jgi:hypothetical protein
MLPQPQRVRKTSDFGTEWAANFDSKESAGCCLAYVGVFGTAKPNRPQPKMCATLKLDHRLGLGYGYIDSLRSLCVFVASFESPFAPTALLGSESPGRHLPASRGTWAFWLLRHRHEASTVLKEEPGSQDPSRKSEECPIGSGLRIYAAARDVSLSRGRCVTPPTRSWISDRRMDSRAEFDR